MRGKKYYFDDFVSLHFNHFFANPVDLKELLVEGSGQNKSFSGSDLSLLNLENVNFTNANLSYTKLSTANLRRANFRGARLDHARLDGADLSGAYLTGAYIENWSITNKTKLDDVQCDYVYMRVPTESNPNPIRKPDNLYEFFQAGDLADFVRPLTDTLDLYHSQGADPRTISIAFKTLAEENPNSNLEIAAIEKRGQSGFLLRVKTAEAADKSELSRFYFESYNQLQSLPIDELRMLAAQQSGELRALSNAIQHLIETGAHQYRVHAKTIQVQGDFMPEQNRNINVGRDLKIRDSVLNLGEISSTVTNAINQLPDRPDPDQPNLKHLLMELQTAIETDSDLPDTDKADLLEQVQNLAEAKQTEELAKQEGLVRKAKKIFEATLKSLPETAKIAEACSQLLPMILKALGFSV